MAANPGKTPMWAGRTGGMAVAVALLVAFAVYVFAEDGPIALAVVAGGVAVVGATQLVRRRAGRAISREVQGASAGSATPAAPPPAPAPVSDELPTRPSLPIAVDVVSVASMPAVSEESRARFDVIHSRGVRVRGLYRRAVFLLALASAALTFLASRISPDVRYFPWAVPLLLVLTLVFLVYDAGRWGKVEREWKSGADDSGRSVPARVGAALRTAVVAVSSVIGGDNRQLLSTARRARGGAAAERARWEEEIVPLRPVLVPVLGAAWLAVSVAAAVAYVNPSGIVFVVPVVLYLVALGRGKAGLERRYPVDAPLNLLTLRVFSSPSLQDFILMTDGWRWFGPMQRLDGSDTAGSSLRHVMAYLRGNVKNAIVEDDAELARALATFGATPDGQLRYPLNSMQCNDATWKQALQATLDDADAVVMDLSGFNEQRRGCAYEIGKLVGEVPLRRFILLVNEDTDMAYLRRVLQDAWASRPESSPNAGTEDPIHLLEIPAEATDVDRERLVGALRDAASGARDAPAPRVLPWARPGLPRFCVFL